MKHLMVSKFYIIFAYMKKRLIILFILISIGANAQLIDWNNFDEQTMNDVMFVTMNTYVKKIHNGDSLILSSVIQKDIMADNYNFFKSNKSLLIHNPKWSNRLYNDLPDTIRIKIINENINPKYLKSKWMEKYKYYYPFSYTEIIEKCIFDNINSYTYQWIAQYFIDGWNKSPAHAMLMNGDYQNEVIVGVATYYNKNERAIYISFVYVR